MDLIPSPKMNPRVMLSHLPHSSFLLIALLGVFSAIPPAALVVSQFPGAWQPLPKVPGTNGRGPWSWDAASPSHESRLIPR